jgi:hypothetical protein
MIFKNLLRLQALCMSLCSCLPHAWFLHNCMRTCAYEGHNPLHTVYNQFASPGNTEQGKCHLKNEYLFFIGRWYYEKNILFL